MICDLNLTIGRLRGDLTDPFTTRRTERCGLFDLELIATPGRGMFLREAGEGSADSCHKSWAERGGQKHWNLGCLGSQLPAVFVWPTRFFPGFLSNSFSSLGIITPYRAQKNFIDQLLSHAKLLCAVRVATVDAYQGRTKSQRTPGLLMIFLWFDRPRV